MSSPLPTGTVTFLFTDIEGSTLLWEKYPEAMQHALARHDALLRGSVLRRHGAIVKGRGDGLHAVFERAIDGVMAAMEAQAALQSQPWSETGPLKVRMAVATGEPLVREGDYYGRTPNRAARLMAAGHGGQILMALATAELVRDKLPAEVSLRALGEHRLKDLARPEQVFQLVTPELPADFPPLNSLDNLPNNLPAQLSSFVGRERELAEVRSLLHTTRLLTLTGPGGTGKTRLSLQLAAELLDQFDHGVWLVELASLADPALVAQSAAAALGVVPQPGRPMQEALIDYMRSKRLLLLLDNCEHLLDACATLADGLLRAAPNLKIMTSSREVLGIAGETAYRVPPLALPQSADAPAEVLLRSDCVRLFHERALAAKPNFVLTEKEAPLVAVICRRLDGIPLAIELAAARVRMLTVEQIATRLDDRFRLLTGGSRTALPRQQTLQALIDWSWDLLGEAEQTLLRRLAVFKGGWTLEAAEQICADFGSAASDEAAAEETNGAALAASDILDLLGELVDKSLVITAEQGDEERFDLLQTIRQYALEKLVAAVEAEAIRDRHLAYFAALGERAEPDLRGPRQREWSRRLEVDHDNIREALTWSLSAGPGRAVELAGAISRFWMLRGYSLEGYDYLRASLAAADRQSGGDDLEDVSRQAARARALLGLSMVSLTVGRNEEGARAALDSVELWRRLGDTPRLAQVLGMATAAFVILGQNDRLASLVQEVIALGQESDDPFARFTAHWMQAMLALQAGDAAEADRFQKNAIRLGRDSAPWESATMLFGLANGYARVGDVAQARRTLTEVEGLFRELGDRHFVNATLSELAHLERQEGNVAAAISAYRETLPRWQEQGHRPAVAHQLESLAFAALQQAGREANPERRVSQLQDAATLLGAAEQIREESGTPRVGPELAEYDGEVAALRALLDGDSLGRAWAHGRALDLNGAVSYALEHVRAPGTADLLSS